MRFRAYTPFDVEAMFRLDALCFTEHFQFDRDLMREFAETPGAIVLLVDDDETGRLIAFVILHLEGPSHGLYAYVVTIDVAPDRRRSGIAAAMLERAESAARTAGARLIELHVAVNNHAAIAFYERQHYRRTGIERRFYREAGQDAIVFAKAL